jgi:hypothetical protein
MLALAVLLSAAGCKNSQDASSSVTSASQPGADQSQAQDQSDPASANLAPVSSDTSNAAPSAGGEQAASPASDDDDSSNGEQPVATAPQPPPPLPEYDQPAAPGDGYLWTPGYWNYASAGYYWVPGVWVQAPYQGALWTPGYWGYVGGHYGFFRGYWGPHIGFYGGVNYGAGYVGTGYQGGYWNSGHFFYNRTVNHIDTTVVHNVYSHPVPSNTVRVSFHGGQGGIRIRPRPAELAALREPHAPPMHAQVQNEHAASTNHAQFANVNHGRPASLVVEKPLAADHNVRPVAAPEPRSMVARDQHAAPEAHARPAAHPEQHRPEHPAAKAKPSPEAKAKPSPEKKKPEQEHRPE